jgi:hypothetical protein
MKTLTPYLDIERDNNPNMEYYRAMYKDSEKWDGKKELTGKKVIIYCEQGHGDQIQFLRFVRFFKAMDCEILLHAPKSLHRLIDTLGVGRIDRDNTPLPNHDYHVLSFSMPFYLKQIIPNFSIPIEPYITVLEKTELIPGYNIGIAWEGSPLHKRTNDRNCPLKYFKSLISSGINLFLLQPTIQDFSLIEGCEDMDLKGVEIEDFYDVAKLINSLDMVVTVDTAALHLAGAMGMVGYGLIGNKWEDRRWRIGFWYPTIKLLKCDWEEAFKKVTKI